MVISKNSGRIPQQMRVNRPDVDDDPVPLAPDACVSFAVLKPAKNAQTMRKRARITINTG
jgi:hypothetical protein